MERESNKHLGNSSLRNNTTEVLSLMYSYHGKKVLEKKCELITVI